MTVHIPSPLFSYTRERQIEASASTLAALLGDLDRRYPGIRFRMINEQGGIREHIRFFVNGELTTDLQHPLRPTDELQIICAISGG